ncbi:MAG: hypothetical protein KDC48_06420, partial [Planctomycetes bacterium]|nr:hypothetical protein [Planctomycetota bacterium]
MRSAARARLIARAGMVGAGVLTLGLALWLAFDRSVAPTVALTDAVGNEFAESAAVVETVELPPLAIAAPEQRVPVATTGTVVVVVQRATMPVADAAVILEPLEDPPLVFRHQVNTGSRQWVVTQAARPAPEPEHRHGATVADGRCRFDGLRCGYWIARAGGVDAVCEVRAGRTVEVVLA